MEFLIIPLALVAAQFAGVYGSRRHFRKALLSEEKFHVLTDGGHPRVVDGPRRTPLQVSEAETQLSAVNELSKRLSLSWPLSLWRLYGPRRNKPANSELDRVRKLAIESQRNEIIKKAFNKGHDNVSLVTLVMRSEDDETFRRLGALVEVTEPGKELEFPQDLRQRIDNELAEQENLPELVLYSSKKASNNSKVIDRSGLPHGYSYELSWIDRGGEFEKIKVAIVDPKGKPVRYESFYTSVYSSPSEQLDKLRRIKGDLAYAARHDMSPSGFSQDLLDAL